MLSLVREALIGAGLVAPNAKLLFNVTVSRGEAISIDVCDPRRGWYHVQASCYYDLSSRFDSCRLAHTRFPKLTPETFTHVRQGDWSILIARACEHRAMCPDDLAGTPASAPLVRDLIDFFATARAHAVAESASLSHDTLMREVRSYFLAAPQTSVKVLGFLQHLDRSAWADIPYVPQHGDFVLNNLGCAGGHLLVFDWEDYGATGLAGFDICLISLSVAGMTAEAAMLIQHTEKPMGCPWSFAQQACSASGLDYQTYRNTIPVYLLVFRYLKRTYGLEIGRRIDDILSRLLP